MRQGRHNFAISFFAQHTVFCYNITATLARGFFVSSTGIGHVVIVDKVNDFDQLDKRD